MGKTGVCYVYSMISFSLNERHFCFRLGRKNLILQSASSPVNLRRFYTADAIPSVTLEGEEKRYAPKIQQLVKDISQLTLIEVADLNELLKVLNHSSCW